MDVPPPQRQHPVVHLDGRGHGDDEGRGRKEIPEVWVHPTHVHMVRPDEEAQDGNRQRRPHHHAIAKDRPSRVRRKHIRDDAEGRSATMYTSGWPKNQNRCWNSRGRAAALSRGGGWHEEAGAEGGVERHLHPCRAAGPWPIPLPRQHPGTAQHRRTRHPAGRRPSRRRTPPPGPLPHGATARAASFTPRHVAFGWR